jgi:hypothetical protein
MDQAWKIFEERDNRPHFLYHALGGQRGVALDQWLLADRKWVKEGSNPYYWSGFHVYQDLDSIRNWMHWARRFTTRVCVQVTVRNVSKKPTAGQAWLAQSLQLDSRQWAARIPLGDLHVSD